jgi:putative flippase GtrA
MTTTVSGSHSRSATSGSAPGGRAVRGVFASLARFTLLGGGLGVASSAALPVVAMVMPWAVANALITVASTALGTELHARFTFGTGRHAGWRQHLQSASSATAAYLVTSAAMLLLHAARPDAGLSWEQAVYLGASGLAGLGRFLVLRLYVFARDRRRASWPSYVLNALVTALAAAGGTRVACTRCP